MFVVDRFLSKFCRSFRQILIADRFGFDSLHHEYARSLHRFGGVRQRYCSSSRLRTPPPPPPPLRLYRVLAYVLMVSLLVPLELKMKFPFQDYFHFGG